MRDKKYHELMKKAAKRAETQPVTPERCRNGSFKDYGKFMSLAAHLQLLVGSEPIHFPNADTSNLLGHGRWRFVRTHRAVAVREGYLTEVEPQRGSRSARYRVNLDRFPELQVVNK